jgi:phage gpG-like protein
MRITIEVSSRAIDDALERLIAAAGPQGLARAWRGIGEDLVASTKARFVTGTAPDGSRWARNAESTLLKALGERHYRKDGRINAAGAALLANKRPLVQSGVLADTIAWQLTDDGATLEVGTDRFADTIKDGAAVHQLGSRDGRIPARPFLGLSDEDEARIMAVLDEHIDRAIRG